MRIYTIFDSKAKTYGSPFFSPNDITASRHLAVACNDPKVQLSMFPDEFDLYCVGQFSDEHAVLIPEADGQRHIVSGLSAKQMIKREENR